MTIIGPAAVDFRRLRTSRPEKTQCGNWRFNRRTNTLDYHAHGRGVLYEIDLDKMGTSAACLDWIFQVAFKIWMSAQDRSDLLEAIRDRVRPQATLCSWGIERGKTAREA
jgi:hypothetical protein